MTAAERIYQADPDDHPPLMTLHQTNLPVPATAFLGRESELAELAALLGRDEVRLVTLTGPGGTGKTRLALQAAAAAADAFAGGVWWVPLAALRDPALVLESAAQALGASGDLAEHIGSVIRSGLDEEAFAEASERGRTMSIEEAVSLAVG